MSQHISRGGIEGKKCSACGHWKPLEEYHRHSRNPDMLAYACKLCAVNRASNWQKENTDRTNAKNRLWRKQHLEQTRKAGRQRRARYRRDYYDRVLAQNRARRAKSTKAPGNGVSAESWERILAQYGGVCLACGGASDLTMDHVVALSKGGAHDIVNVQPLCRSCNSAKGTEYADYR